MMTTNTIINESESSVKQSKDSQCAKFVAFMRRNGSITDNDARSFGCNRLAARICDLKKRGYFIHAELERGVNRDGERVNYARYRLIEEDK